MATYGSRYKLTAAMLCPRGPGGTSGSRLWMCPPAPERTGKGPQPEAMSRPSSVGAGGGGLGAGKAGGGKHGGSGGAAAAAAAVVAAAAAAATAGVGSVSGSGSSAPSSAVSLPMTGLAGQSTELTALFECPVCFDYVLPPILQCQAGHLVCNQCRQKLSCCPTCRGPLTPSIRNLAMEKVASTLPFPCKVRLSRSPTNTDNRSFLITTSASLCYPTGVSRVTS